MCLCSRSLVRGYYRRRYKPKGSKHRSREEIIANILQTAWNQTTVSKTWIMRKTFISYEQLQKYLHHTTQSELLAHDDQSNQYKITPKGMEFVNHFDRAKEIEGELHEKKQILTEMLS